MTKLFGRFLGIAFIFCLIVLSLIRFAFIQHYGNGLQSADILAALQRGFLFDAKWSAVVLLPALLLLILSLIPRCEKLHNIAKIATVVGGSAVFLLALVNFAFFGFYGTPINSLIFGFLEDDTVAVVITIWKDWPVFTYLSILLGFVGVLAWLVKKSASQSNQSFVSKLISICLLTVILGISARGSIGKFPLRHTDLNISTNTFINQSVNNGGQAFYDAIKERKSQDVGKDPLRGLKAFGFKSIEEAQQFIPKESLTSNQAATKPHIVLAVMEAMGRDLFESHQPGNNMLGSFEEAMSHGDLFLNAISSENGTFPSLEGLIFNTPISPISQSKYGFKGFEFSQVLPFKNVGYRTIFLTSGTAAWRNIANNFPKHGFDEIYDDVTLKQRYQITESNTWGVPDQYMFDYAAVLLQEAEQKGERLFIVMLSTTNHSPHQTPQNYDLKPVSFDLLPAWKSHKDVKLSLAILETYQYATDALGKFILSMPDSIKDQTIVVATGDHNTRSVFEYPDASRLDRQFGVPVYFQVPPTWRPSSPNTTKWVGHFDIFATLKEIVLNQTPLDSEGCNVYSSTRCEAITFSQIFGGKGIAINEHGAVANFANPQFFEWANHRLQPTNKPSSALQELWMKAKAKVSMADYNVRSALIELPQK